MTFDGTIDEPTYARQEFESDIRNANDPLDDSGGSIGHSIEQVQNLGTVRDLNH
jgi:hypothetical protein